jgi:uncharacterized membrane protein YsdA (DUF1294 family)
MSSPRKPTFAKSNSNSRDRRWTTATLFAIPCFAVLYLAVSVLWKPPLWIAALYILASLITFAVYAWDKSAAMRGTWRTPEKTLHLLALTGGWPGALLAQQFLRHKSVKSPFRVVFWLTVAMNVLGFLALTSPIGLARL